MGRLGNEAAAPYAPNARVLILNVAAKCFEPLRPGVNAGAPNRPHAWGPLVQYANEWLAAHPTGTLRIALVSRGSTGLAQDPEQLDWSPASRGELFDQAATAATLLAELGQAPVTRILVMQGETDAAEPRKAAAYRVNFQGFVQAARAAWAAPGAVMVVGRISAQVRFAGVEAVRRGQEAAAARDPCVRVVDTDDLPLADGLHFAQAAVVALGQRYFLASRQACGGSVAR